LRYGLYLSHDNGTTWELVSERDDFGATLHHPSGALFAVTGDDGVNHGSRLLRSPDLGKTWRDITGTAPGQFMYIEPDPDRPGLVRIHCGGLRITVFEADDESYRWKAKYRQSVRTGRRPSDEFFSRASFSTNRFHVYPATLANYFRYDFGNQTNVQALEVVPLEPRYVFTQGARVIVPVRVNFYFDADTLWPDQRKAGNEPRPVEKPTQPKESLADLPDETTFWGLRVESADSQIATYPAGRRTVTVSGSTTVDGKTVASEGRPAASKYRVVELSPTSPYEREIDLGRLADFSKPGEYRVQIVYDSGGHPDGDKSVWDGRFTSPVFTIVIRE
jgi:hypothetical protein